MAKDIRFKVNPSWNIILHDLNQSVSEVLKRAELPLDLFARKDASLSTEAYFRFWRTLELIFEDPIFPLRIIRNISSEVFDPPIFAAYCSANLNTALQRLSQFKTLIGPMKLDVDRSQVTTNLTLRFLEKGLQIPTSLAAAELGFFVQLARMATREHLIPLKVTAPCHFSPIGDFSDFFGVTPVRGDGLFISFSAEDAAKPFLTENAQMWEYFEPGLRKRLSKLDGQEGMEERVRSALLEMLPCGQTSINDLTRRLFIGRRTLQRRLGEEGTSFKSVLTDVRVELARHYITKSELPYPQISFLLGYDDPNSFFRAFRSWTGATPQSLRTRARP